MDEVLEEEGEEREGRKKMNKVVLFYDEFTDEFFTDRFYRSIFSLTITDETIISSVKFTDKSFTDKFLIVRNFVLSTDFKYYRQILTIDQKSQTLVKMSLT